MENRGVPVKFTFRKRQKLLWKHCPRQVSVPRGKIAVKGKGETSTLFVNPKDVGTVLPEKKTFTTHNNHPKSVIATPLTWT